MVSTYFERYGLDVELPVRRDTVPDLAVVIPCYNEPDIFRTLESLQNNIFDGFTVEVFVVVNSGEQTPESIVEFNRTTFAALRNEVEKWNGHLFLTPVWIENVRRKHAGVGYARKVGMDLAVKRFAQRENSDGIIVSLDADTTVASNYLQEIDRCFQNNPELSGAIIRFQHEIGGTDYGKEIYEAVTNYELHLRYFNQALKYTGFPYVHHTVGSAFAVRASVYVAHGGMNRRQGGEDFYFLYKLFPHGQFIDLNTTCVYPSSRPSDRVPFGTGPQIREFVQSGELLTYNMDAFVALKSFIDIIPQLYTTSKVEIPACVKQYLETVDFENHLREIRTNAASETMFVKRFFVFFDAFKVVKYLNFVHQSFFEKQNVIAEAKKLLELLGIVVDNSDAKWLLNYFRALEQK